MNGAVAVETRADPTDAPLPSASDLGMRWLLGFALVLQVWAWSRLEGYQLADSVEYMERAWAAAVGTELHGQQAVRSFAFSLVFLPMFAVADWIGLDDLRPLAYLGRLIQMTFGAGLIVATSRVGARLGGRSSGWAAGILIAINPVFLRYSVSPVAGIAAALFVTVGLERALWRTGRRSAWIGGLWLGLAVLCSYKSLLVVLVLLVWIIMRDRWKERSSWIGLGGGVLLACGLQALLDRVVYGRWGGSLFGWVMNNVFSRIVDWSFQVHERTTGAISEKARAFALWFYERQNEFMGYYLDSSHLERRQRRGSEWYLENLTELLVWPVIILVALGLLRSLRRPRSRGFAFAFIVVVFAFVTSTKGDKSFRLWLPILPLIAILGAGGFGLLYGRWRAAPARRATAYVLIIAALPFGLRSFLNASIYEHGSYWRAIDWINERAPKSPQDEPMKVGAAYEWAIFLRSAPGVQLDKSAYSLQTWTDAPDAPGDDLAEERRRAIRAHLESLDRLIVHLPLFISRPGLLQCINGLFAVEAIFYHQEENAEVGPVYVLRRRDIDGATRRFYTLRFETEADDFRRARGFERPIAFRSAGPLSGGSTPGYDVDDDERLTLLGWELEPIPGDGLYWLTYHWTTDTGFVRDWKIIDRATAPDAHNSFQNNHWPAYGVLPTSSWRPGWIVSEGFAFVPSGDPFARDTGYLPLGGPFRRGDLLPLSLWIGVFIEDENGRTVERMQAGFMQPSDTMAKAVDDLIFLEGLRFERPDALEIVAERHGIDPADFDRLEAQVLDPGRNWIRHGFQSSLDELLEVGRFFLPVQERARVPDDGRPLTY